MVMSLRGWNKWTYSMSIDYRLKLNHREQSEGKNGKLAQLYLFFHPQDSVQPQPSKVCSWIAVVSMQEASGHKQGNCS